MGLLSRSLATQRKVTVTPNKDLFLIVDNVRGKNNQVCLIDVRALSFIKNKFKAFQ